MKKNIVKEYNFVRYNMVDGDVDEEFPVCDMEKKTISWVTDKSLSDTFDNEKLMMHILYECGFDFQDPEKYHYWSECEYIVK